MLALYLFTKYLAKKDDYQFEQIWEKKVLLKQRYYWFGALLYFFIVVGLFSELLLIGNTNFLIGFLVTGLILVLYGIYFLRAILQFIAIQNQRYLRIKMGLMEDTFSKDNVVG
jgi:hypothetical protein